jgi:hypothetical protein
MLDETKPSGGAPGTSRVPEGSLCRWQAPGNRENPEYGRGLGDGDGAMAHAPCTWRGVPILSRCAEG